MQKSSVAARVSPTPVVPTKGPGLLRELGAAWQLARLGAALPRMVDKTSTPRTVVLIPGWMAGEWSMAPLRSWLRLRGHDARHWGLGTNRGRPEKDAFRMLEVLHGLPEPAVLVGWSLGGVIARELARFAPDLVRGVVTYGTPVIGGPTYTLAADAWGADECERIRRVSDALQSNVPIEVPITTMYSREDRVVSWAACIDRYATSCTHIEVTSSHVGMGLDPDVWSVTAKAIEA